MLKLTDLKKTFDIGTPNEKEALCGVDLHLKEADFITVIGSNGAGKSTVLNAVAGDFMLDSGKVEIDGLDMTRLKEHARARYIGRVFQDPRMGTATGMTIEENLAIAFRRSKIRSFRWGISRKERDIFRNNLRKLGLGLEDRLTVKTGLLSGGQRQALTLMMATLVRPKLLLLDEHTAALDPKTAKIVLELTQKLVEEDKLTTLMVTHNMKDALRFGNRIVMMHEGNIILDIGYEQKKNLTVKDLLQKFEQASGDEISSDRLLLG